MPLSEIAENHSPLLGSTPSMTTNSLEGCSKAQETPPTSSSVPFNPRRAPKSRNGCLRCKAKRLKCDERKPECAQCNKKNFSCPGYKTKPLVWSTKHEKLLAPETTLTLASETTEPTPQHKTQDKGTALTPPRMASPLPSTAGAATPQIRHPSPPPLPPHLLLPHSTPSKPLTDSLTALRHQLTNSTIPSFLLHIPTMLVEYYFTYVCQIFSSFDSTLNPFRSTIARLWDGSAPIYYAIQSMAAAYLANHFPKMTMVGRQMQRETYRCLYNDLGGREGEGEGELDKALLTVLLVGQTTAWHDPKDLGIVHLRTAKRLNWKRLERQNSAVSVRERRQNEFFEQCILYWDMLAGFVKDDIEEFDLLQLDVPSPSTTPTTPPNTSKEMIFPHPWTGVQPTALLLFSRVGRLIRSYRKTLEQDLASLDFMNLDLTFDLDLPQSTTLVLSAAKTLEEELLGLEMPNIESLVDAGDQNTPVNHYLLLAEAYRCAGLGLIYRVWPALLEMRVPPTINLELNNPFSFLPQPPTSGAGDFVLSLALHTISLLQSIPSNSGTRCLQPIILIAAGSELHFSSPSSDPLASFLATSVGVGELSGGITTQEIDIAAAREFIIERFGEFCKVMPDKPLKKAVVLVQEVWRRGDEGEGMCGGVGRGMGEGVFWMDVMESMGGGTIWG